MISANTEPYMIIVWKFKNKNVNICCLQREKRKIILYLV